MANAHDLLMAQRAAMMGKPLPYDAEVEWLYSDGEPTSPWILIPYVNEYPAKFELSWMPTARPRSYGRSLTISGSSSGGSIIIRTSMNSNFQVLVYVSNASSTVYPEGASVEERKTTEVDVFEDRRVMVSQGSVSRSFDASGLPNGTGAVLCLWVTNKQEDTRENFCGRIYGLKIWSDGVLKMDLIAVRKDGVGYFYDKVSKSMFSNTNANATVPFGIGPDKT